MKTIITTIILAAAATTAFAQTAETGKQFNRGDRMFSLIDVNEDGYVDLAELTKFHANMPQRGPKGNRGQGGPNVNKDAAVDDSVAPNPRGQRGPGRRGQRAMPTPEMIIENHDADGDGKLSREEFQMGGPRQARGPGNRGKGQAWKEAQPK